MPKFILAYRGQHTKPADPAAHMGKWKEWVAGLGDAAVNRGTPLGKSVLVSADGVSDEVADPMSGYSIVSAPDMDAALEIAKGCPYLDIGNLEVAEIKELR